MLIETNHYVKEILFARPVLTDVYKDLRIVRKVISLYQYNITTVLVVSADQVSQGYNVS